MNPDPLNLDPLNLDDPFDVLMAQVTGETGRFDHRGHVHLTWLAVRQFGTRDAIDVVSQGIRRTARYAGAPQKYHVTVSRAWVELVGHHLQAGPPEEGFEQFLARVPDLLDKRLLARHYRSSTLASAHARTGWVEPDLEPLPRGRLP